ncbi:MAG: peptide deformylase [Clostridiaceae bacterium]|nr:peptide deformylase [Clostridiaceae bacterium]
MALRQIVTEENDLLRKVSRPVDRVDTRIQTLIDDMLQTMKASNGIGLAAVQVGVLRRLFVMDIQDGNGPYVLINPKIVASDGSQVGQEGCLSVPGIWGDVERPAHVVMQALDRGGKPFTLEAEGLLAVCACHEYDHLDGILFRDKVIGSLVKT